MYLQQNIYKSDLMKILSMQMTLISDESLPRILTRGKNQNLQTHLENCFIPREAKCKQAKFQWKLLLCVLFPNKKSSKSLLIPTLKREHVSSNTKISNGISFPNFIFCTNMPAHYAISTIKHVIATSYYSVL